MIALNRSEGRASFAVFAGATAPRLSAGAAAPDSDRKEVCPEAQVFKPALDVRFEDEYLVAVTVIKGKFLAPFDDPEILKIERGRNEFMGKPA